MVEQKKWCKSVGGGAGKLTYWLFTGLYQQKLTRSWEEKKHWKKVCKSNKNYGYLNKETERL